MLSDIYSMKTIRMQEQPHNIDAQDTFCNEYKQSPVITLKG